MVVTRNWPQRQVAVRVVMREECAARGRLRQDSRTQWHQGTKRKKVSRKGAEEAEIAERLCGAAALQVQASRPRLNDQWPSRFAEQRNRSAPLRLCVKPLLPFLFYAAPPREPISTALGAATGH